MKTHHIAAIALAVFVAILAAMFWRQSALESEMAALRASVDAIPRDHPLRDPAGSTAAPTSGGSPAHIGTVRPFIADADDAIADARRRVAELENVVNNQADIIEKLLDESRRAAEAVRRRSMRSWGPEQATGAPDTMSAGDQRTAWAPSSADGGVEWIEAEFENPADLAQIMVRQTSNPGGITKVTAVLDSGSEVPVWQGSDPSAGQELADTPFSAPAGINARKVKVYIDTSKKAGWEEVDAIQITGRNGAKQWAKSVNASSTYAGGRSMALGGDYGIEGFQTLQNWSSDGSATLRGVQFHLLQETREPKGASVQSIIKR